MGDSRKELRKALRPLVQEMLPELLTKELIAEIDRKLTEDLSGRLTAIDTTVSKEMKRQDDRAKSIQGFLMREVTITISDRLHNANVTMLAWQELMQDKLGLSTLEAVEAFNKELDARKLAINERLKAEAVAKQQATIDAPGVAQVQADARAAAAQQDAASAASQAPAGDTDGKETVDGDAAQAAG